MKHNLKLLTLLSAFFMCSCANAPERSYNEGINIIPTPLSLEIVEAQPFVLSSETSIYFSDDQLPSALQELIAQVELASGCKFNNSSSAESADIVVQIKGDEQLKSEGYTLEVTSEKISIQAQDLAGAYYGMQTLLQLLPAEVESRERVRNVEWSIPTVKIIDEPRFTYRGIMLDVSRHFMPVEFVKKQIDIFAMFKINRLHLHLTDDQGWRIEIKKYPLLTEVGSRRVDSQGNVHEGFYTQEQIKEIVAYAAQRQITIVPEIDLPGHQLAAISAYPELSCRNTVTSPRVIWGVEDVVICPGKEISLNFLDDVITEVAALFPGEYVHVGGDECPKDSWKECPLCQAKIKQEGLKATDKYTAEERLQSYIVSHMEQTLKGLGKKLIGWDEILEGGLPEDATVMSWRGEEGGIEAAQMGHHVIMTPQQHGLYLNYYQGDNKIEPVTIGGNSLLSVIYDYDPTPESLKESGMEHFVEGVQANVWSEYMTSLDLVEYQIYPRVMALAEIGWSEMERRNYDDFCRRVNNGYVRLDGHNVNYHVPMPEQPNGSCNYIAFVDSVALEFTTSRPIKMEYSINGGKPTEYTAPIQFTTTSTLEIYSVLPSGKKSTVRTIAVEKQEYNPSTEIEGLKEGLIIEVYDGAHYFNTEELKAADLKPTTYRALKHWNHMILRKSMVVNDIEMYAMVAKGYVDIPEDGVYFFSSDNDEVWIDGELLINNRGETKRYSRNDKSIALQKGLHSIETTFLANVMGGWPSIWNSPAVSIRAAKEEEFSHIAIDMLYHKPRN